MERRTLLRGTAVLAGYAAAESVLSGCEPESSARVVDLSRIPDRLPNGFAQMLTSTVRLEVPINRDAIYKGAGVKISDGVDKKGQPVSYILTSGHLVKTETGATIPVQDCENERMNVQGYTKDNGAINGRGREMISMMSPDYSNPDIALVQTTPLTRVSNASIRDRIPEWNEPLFFVGQRSVEGQLFPERTIYAGISVGLNKHNELVVITGLGAYDTKGTCVPLDPKLAKIPHKGDSGGPPYDTNFRVVGEIARAASYADQSRGEARTMSPAQLKKELKDEGINITLQGVPADAQLSYTIVEPVNSGLVAKLMHELATNPDQCISAL